MQDFYTSLPSNTVFEGKKNTTSQFRVRLPEEISLGSEDWEVALVELQYPHTWNNLGDGDENALTVTANDGTTVKIEIHHGHYNTIEDLLAVLQKSLETVQMPVNDKKTTSAGCRSFKFVMDFLNKHVLFRCVQPGKLRFVRLSKKLQYLMGFDQHEFTSTTPFVRAKYPPDLRGGIDTLFVYCDLVSPQIIGNTKEKLLRVVPVSGFYGEIVDKVFHSPHYVPVLKKKFSTIEMTIYTDQNEPILFQFGKSLVKLHFRRHRTFRI